MNSQHNHIPDHHRKMDILYFNAIKRAKSNNNRCMGFNIFKLLLMIIFLLVDVYYYKTNQQMIVLLLILFIGSVIFQIIVFSVVYQYAYSNNRSNNDYFLILALQNMHLTQQFLNKSEDIDDINLCVSSSMYNYVHRLQNDSPLLNQQRRLKYQMINSDLISMSVIKNNKFLFLISTLRTLIKIALFVIGIIILVKSHPSTIQIVVISIYLAFQLPIIVLIVFIILLLPIITCLLCIWFCCIRSSTLVNRDAMIIPEAVLATNRIIEQTDGSCTVCLQNFGVGEKVIILQCSQHHVFHEGCIMNWLRVSNSCPICRTQLPSSI